MRDCKDDSVLSRFPFRRIGPEQVPAWDTASVAEAMCVSKKTILRWVAETRDGKMAFPFFQPHPRGKIFFPIGEVIYWANWKQE